MVKPFLYDVFMRIFERDQFKNARKSLFQYAKGDILEIGSGTGVNFPLYQQVKRVHAIEQINECFKDLNRGKTRQPCQSIYIKPMQRNCLFLMPLLTQ